MSTVVNFQDFNFKLMVIERLMYREGVLGPEFTALEFAHFYTERQINLDEEGFRIIPEIKQYFLDFEIPEEHLNTLTGLSQEVDNDIYMQILPFWDGDDDTFHLKSADDLELLPNLKWMKLFKKTKPAIVAKIEAKGIKVTF